MRAVPVVRAPWLGSTAHPGVNTRHTAHLEPGPLANDAVLPCPKRVDREHILSHNMTDRLSHTTHEAQGFVVVTTLLCDPPSCAHP